MPRQKRDPIEYLFNARKNVAPDQDGKVTPVKKMLRSTAFFPGGSGLWHTPPKEMLPSNLQWASYSFFVNSKSPSMPKKKIMILGNDFGLKAWYENAFDYPYKNLKSPTWRNLLELLHRDGIKPKNCFFTNAYMGLRITDKSTGQSPGMVDLKFVKRCQSFFLDRQLPMQKPRLILVLGAEARKFIAQLSPDLGEWKECETFTELDDSDLGPVVKKVRFNGSKPITVVALVHPAGRNMGSALKNRRYRGKEGEDAESKMLKKALKKSGLKK